MGAHGAPSRASIERRKTKPITNLCIEDMTRLMFEAKKKSRELAAEVEVLDKEATAAEETVRRATALASDKRARAQDRGRQQMLANQDMRRLEREIEVKLGLAET